MSWKIVDSASTSRKLLLQIFLDFGLLVVLSAIAGVVAVWMAVVFFPSVHPVLAYYGASFGVGIGLLFWSDRRMGARVSASLQKDSVPSASFGFGCQDCAWNREARRWAIRH